jgi:predicted nucleic acid-binding protein
MRCPWPSGDDKAFHRKLREGTMRPAGYAALLRQLRAHNELGAFRWLAQDEEILSRIADVYAKLPATVFLRAADAIHLATAAGSGFQIVYSNDVHLLNTAKHFGIEGRDIIGRSA